MKKKLLSLAVVLAMVLTMLPTVAFAADPEDGTMLEDSVLVTVTVDGEPVVWAGVEVDALTLQHEGTVAIAKETISGGTVTVAFTSDETTYEEGPEVLCIVASAEPTEEDFETEQSGSPDPVVTTITGSGVPVSIEDSQILWLQVTGTPVDNGLARGASAGSGVAAFANVTEFAAGDVTEYYKITITEAEDDTSETGIAELNKITVGGEPVDLSDGVDFDAIQALLETVSAKIEAGEDIPAGVSQVTISYSSDPVPVVITDPAEGAYVSYMLYMLEDVEGEGEGEGEGEDDVIAGLTNNGSFTLAIPGDGDYALVLESMTEEMYESMEEEPEELEGYAEEPEGEDEIIEEPLCYLVLITMSPEDSGTDAEPGITAITMNGVNVTFPAGVNDPTDIASTTGVTVPYSEEGVVIEVTPEEGSEIFCVAAGSENPAEWETSEWVPVTNNTITLRGVGPGESITVLLKAVADGGELFWAFTITMNPPITVTPAAPTTGELEGAEPETKDSFAAAVGKTDFKDANAEAIKNVVNALIAEKDIDLSQETLKEAYGTVPADTEVLVTAKPSLYIQPMGFNNDNPDMPVARIYIDLQIDLYLSLEGVSGSEKKWDEKTIYAVGSLSEEIEIMLGVPDVVAQPGQYVTVEWTQFTDTIGSYSRAGSPSGIALYSDPDPDGTVDDDGFVTVSTDTLGYVTIKKYVEGGGTGGNGGNGGNGGSTGSVSGLGSGVRNPSAGGGATGGATVTTPIGSDTVSTVGGFSDVLTSNPFATEIAWAQANGILGGYPDGTFRPNANTTRQALWMVLGRLAGVYPANMAEAREWAISAGISDGTNAEGNMSRQQMITMLYRFAQAQGLATTGSADLSGYGDSGLVASYAQEALAWGVANGVITGTTDGRLNPEGVATRAHFAAFVYRFDSLDLAPAPAAAADEIDEITEEDVEEIINEIVDAVGDIINEIADAIAEETGEDVV